MRARLHADLPSEGCPAFVAALDAVVDGAADQSTAAWAESHAADCRACARHLAAARAYRDRLQRVVDRDVAPASLQSRVRSILQEVRGSPTR